MESAIIEQLGVEAAALQEGATVLPKAAWMRIQERGTAQGMDSCFAVQRAVQLARAWWLRRHVAEKYWGISAGVPLAVHQAARDAAAHSQRLHLSNITPALCAAVLGALPDAAATVGALHDLRAPTAERRAEAAALFWRDNAFWGEHPAAHYTSRPPHNDGDAHGRTAILAAATLTSAGIIDDVQLTAIVQGKSEYVRGLLRSLAAAVYVHDAQ